MISNEMVESINNLLEDLSIVDESYRFQSSSELVLNNQNSKFYEIWEELFQFVINNYSHNDSISDEINTSIGKIDTLEKIFQALEMSGYVVHFTIQSDKVLYRLIHFICTLIQAERLCSRQKGGSKRMQLASDKGKLVFQLDKICKDMDIPLTGNQLNLNPQNIMSAVEDKIYQLKTKYSHYNAQDFPKMLEAGSKNNEKGVSLNPSQLQKYEQLCDAIYKDFSLRRRMMIKRMDVTIQSFLWGERSVGKEGIIVAAIKGKMEHIKEEPTKYTLDDVLNAPLSLMAEHSKRVMDRGNNSFVKNIMIGAVPDRGGRTHDMRIKTSGTGGSYTGKKWSDSRDNNRRSSNSNVAENTDAKNSNKNNNSNNNNISAIIDNKNSVNDTTSSSNNKEKPPDSHSKSSGGKGFCFAFQKGSCNRGTNCKFSHMTISDDSGNSNNNDKNKINTSHSSNTPVITSGRVVTLVSPANDENVNNKHIKSSHHRKKQKQ